MNKKNILTTTLPTTNVVFNQDLKTGHCNLTELVEQSNEILGTNKRLDNILNLKSTKELIEYRKQLKINNLCNSEKIDYETLTEKEKKRIENEVIKTVKSIQKSDGWTKGYTTSDMVIALEVATHLDVALKNDVLEYYLDDKRAERLTVRENYKKLSGLVRKNIGDTREIFSDLVHNINGIVFDRFVSDLWNDETTKEQYQEINHIIIKLIGLIEDGDIKTVSELNNKLMQWYNKKYPNNFKQSIQN